MTLFDAMLEQVNDSLKDAGVEVTLTSVKLRTTAEYHDC